MAIINQQHNCGGPHIACISVHADTPQLSRWHLWLDLCRCFERLQTPCHAMEVLFDGAIQALQHGFQVVSCLREKKIAGNSKGTQQERFSFYF